MSLRPGIDFVIAGSTEFAALVCVVDRGITLHQDDKRVRGSKYFRLAPCAVSEPKSGGPAAIRFAPKDWCEKAQKARPREIRIVSAERGMKIAERADQYVKAGMQIADAVKKAYTDITGQLAVETIDVATHEQTRKRFLAKLADERALDLHDQTKWGHLTNDDLRSIYANPVLIEDYEPQQSEAPITLEPVNAEEAERRELYNFLRAQGIKVAGWPGLQKLRAMKDEWAAQDRAAQVAAIEATQAEFAGINEDR